MLVSTHLFHSSVRNTDRRVVRRRCPQTEINDNCNHAGYQLIRRTETANNSLNCNCVSGIDPKSKSSKGVGNVLFVLFSHTNEKERHRLYDKKEPEGAGARFRAFLKVLMPFIACPFGF
jgi:hypothetical protein